MNPRRWIHQHRKYKNEISKHFLRPVYNCRARSGITAMGTAYYSVRLSAVAFRASNDAVAVHSFELETSMK